MKEKYFLSNHRKWLTFAMLIICACGFSQNSTNRVAANSIKNETVATVNYKLAPNSYIFDPFQNNFDGLYIPIKKAFDVWSDTTGYLNQTLSEVGKFSASIYWEDVPGLIVSDPSTPEIRYDLPIIGSGQNAKIKVQIDKTKGEGNAVVVFKIDGEIKWSWHIWVTDTPTVGSTYRKTVFDGSYMEKDMTGNIVPDNNWGWMDRNLGATNVEFTGKDWNKSSGLQYEWGRKDPIPSLVYNDGTFYQVSGEVGIIRHKDATISPTGTETKIKTVYRGLSTGTGSDLINDNIKYSVKNPLNIIMSPYNKLQHWFSNQQYEIPNSDVNSRKNWNLWASNGNGYATNALASNATSADLGRKYLLKSPYDPCPCGWRVPSHYGSNATNNQNSPWGRNAGSESDDINNNSKILFSTANSALPGIKVYPSLGFDLRNSSNRNLGVLPLNGNYETYYTNTTTLGSIVYQDQSADGTLLSSTLSMYNGILGLHIISDPAQVPDEANAFGRYQFKISQDLGYNGTGGVRCIKDPNNAYMPIVYQTEYFTEPLNAYTEGINNPNSYLVTKSSTTKIINIPISKAFSVYNQYLSNHEMPSYNSLKPTVLWTTNQSLIENISIVNPPSSVSGIKDSYIRVVIKAGNSGNAVVSLHNGNVQNPALWSWHVWVTEDQVTELAEYQNQDIITPTNSQFEKVTKSGVPPLKTIFMDRNLGALSAMPNLEVGQMATPQQKTQLINSYGMHYQWGRKDPLPGFYIPGLKYTTNFVHNGSLYNVYKSSGPNADGSLSGTYTTISNTTFKASYIVNYATYTSGTNPNDIVKNNLKYSVENPLKLLRQDPMTGNYGEDWLINQPGYMQERWGHSTTKSPFDPCPEGWRVADLGFVNENANYLKGLTPWYNGYYNKNTIMTYYSEGLIESTTSQSNQNANATYYGARLRDGDAGNIWRGMRYDYPYNATNTSTKWKIGNFPYDGIRENYSGFGINNVNYNYGGSWSAAQSSNQMGFGSALTVNRQDVTTKNSINPTNAMACRCAKITNNIINKTTNKSSQPIESLIPPTVAKSYKVIVYKNIDKIVIKSQQEELSDINVFDLSGRLIYKKENVNQTTWEVPTSQINSQVVLVNIKTKDGKVTSKKVIIN